MASHFGNLIPFRAMFSHIFTAHAQKWLFMSFRLKCCHNIRFVRVRFRLALGLGLALSLVLVLHDSGVAPIRMVGVSASVNLPLHHKVQKFSSGTGSPGWSRKKGPKTVVVVS